MKMGTTTFYLKHNDLGISLNNMTQEEINTLSKLSPYQKNNNFKGWSTPMELHNSNVYLLVFWKGRLMKLEDAPITLRKKYYNSHTGKTLREYEWTILKRFMINEIKYLDKKFKKELRRKKERK